MNRATLRLGLAGVFAVLALASTGPRATASFVYLRSEEGRPWGVTTNEDAMDAAFGVGSWLDARYETVNASALFSAANRFIFMEGGDFTADELEAFLKANRPTIKRWVAAGGSLFVNAAPNEGNGMKYGFGRVRLNYTDFSFDPVTAVDPAHPIFAGPFPTTTSFTGNAFAHASVSGPGLTPLLQDADGRVHLAEKSFGLGHVLFGGMTTTNFHSPDPDAFNLRANTLTYGANQATTANAVPGPSGLVLLAAAVPVLGGYFARRKRPA